MFDRWSNYSLSGGLVDSDNQSSPMLQVQPSGLPERVDLRQFCSPVENQENTNSCVANAVVGALELQQIRAGMALTDLSTLFVYYNARRLLKRENVDAGISVLKGMAALMAYGCCEDKLWPFKKSKINTEPPAKCYENAGAFQAMQFARTPNGPATMSVLAEGFPVVFTMTAPLAYYEYAAKHGIMPRPDQIRAPITAAGHAMLIVGYDQADSTYLVRNSMGTRFGENGYLRIPFETLDVWSMPEDYWTLGDIEKVTKFKLTGPGASRSNADEPAPSDQEPKDGLSKMRSDLRSRLSSDLETSKRDFRTRLRDKNR